MARYVPDILSHRWVIISPQRISRPNDGHGHVKKTCPFCPGNEAMTPPEVLRYGSGEKDKEGWQVRVIPNKFPITDIHEVFIHSPEIADIEDLPLSQVELILTAYRERYNSYKKQGQVFIFGNHNNHAGASLDHPHSQLVVLPYQINLDTLTREPEYNIVTEDKNYTLYCPDFSQWPYELWIVPKKNNTVFGILSDDELTQLAKHFKWALRRVKKIYERKAPTLAFAYNYYIFPKENWYLRIIPRFISRAGFELGTGLSVNVVDPQEAAAEYKKE